MQGCFMKEDLIEQFINVREFTETLCKPLHLEDYSIQGMDDVSPPKWHLAHTTWFFETFILKKYISNYQDFNPSFHYLFNSYYQGIGNPFPRAKRGLLSRPLIREVYDYRKQINQHILNLLNNCSSKKWSQLAALIVFGLEHEQQHQELLLMDIKYNFFLHPDYPIYQEQQELQLPESTQPFKFITVPGGSTTIGYQGKEFCFDNELPAHQILLNPFSMASTLVTNKEYLEFIEDGGYKKPTLWLADGWDWILINNLGSPLYWEKQDTKWQQFTLAGMKPLNLMEPVSHISFFEADAFARWRGCRLPTEAEWEYFVGYAQFDSSNGNFIDHQVFQPKCCSSQSNNLGNQFFGDVWEWTSSTYSPYPGYKPQAGNLGEYNGKFMNNQRVLRGGSCITPAKHIRKSYRNYFQPDKRWQFSGIRLAMDN
jgi:ergothioneine biosynthesis protein EgtB